MASPPRSARGDLKYMMTTIPMFMGYATCFNLQRYVKEALGISSGLFPAAYSLLYMGNLLFRFFHNYIWVFTKPFWRTIISYVAMCAAEVLMMISQLVEWDPRRNNSWVAFLIYLCGGIGIGTFESNILNIMAEISPGARHFAVIGIPVGVNFITIFSFFIIGVLDPVLTAGQVCAIIFAFVTAMMLVAIVILFRYVPHGRFIEGRHRVPPEDAECDGDAAPGNDLTTSVSYLPRAFKNYRQWLLQILPNSICMLGDMFSVSQFSPGIILYTIGTDSRVRFLGMSLKADYYRSIFGIFTFLGDFCSRLIFEKVRLVYPALLLVGTLAGALMVVSGVPEVMMVGGFLILFMNGWLYVQSSKHIRATTEDNQWGLAAYSFWLFVGDTGSVIASFTQQGLAKEICENLRRKTLGGWDPCPYY